MKKMDKTKKIIVASLVVVVLAGGGIGYKVYADGVKKEKIELAVKEAKTNDANVQKLIKKIEANYETASKDYLKKDFSAETLATLKKNADEFLTDKKLSTVKDFNVNEIKPNRGDLKVSIVKLETKFHDQEKVNQLFKEVAINGAEIQSELTIKDDLTEKELETVKSSSFPKNDKWSESMTGFLAIAKGQLDQIKKATASVDTLYQDKTAKPDVSREQIDASNKEVATIKNEKAKTALTERLKPVTEMLAKKEADEKAKAEAESKQVAEAQASATGGTVVQNADGTYSAQAPVVSESPQTGTNNYQANAGGSNQASNGGGTWNQEQTPPPTNNGGGGSSSNGGGNQSNGSTGGWSGQGTQTGGGDVPDYGNSNGATGGGNTWTGGGFDGSGIDTSGWK